MFRKEAGSLPYYRLPVNLITDTAILIWSGNDRQGIRSYGKQIGFESFVFRTVSPPLNITICFPLLMEPDVTAAGAQLPGR